MQSLFFKRMHGAQHISHVTLNHGRHGQQWVSIHFGLYPSLFRNWIALLLIWMDMLPGTLGFPPTEVGSRKTPVYELSVYYYLGHEISMHILKYLYLTPQYKNGKIT